MQKSQEEAIEPHNYGLWWSPPRVQNELLLGMIVDSYVNKQLRKCECCGIVGYPYIGLLLVTKIIFMSIIDIRCSSVLFIYIFSWIILKTCSVQNLKNIADYFQIIQN